MRRKLTSPAAAPRRPAGSEASREPVRGHRPWSIQKVIPGFRRSGERSARVPARTRHLGDNRPVTASELELVAREHHRLHAERERVPQQSRARRRLEERLHRVEDRFERLLSEAPLDEDDRRRWRKALHRRARPPRSDDVPPLLFSGRSAAGSELRLVTAPGGTALAVVDGAAVAVLDDVPELERTAPVLRFSLDGVDYEETFSTPAEALAELREGVSSGRRPPIDDIRAPAEDGLVDRRHDLTARGRRALALDAAPARPPATASSPQITLRGPVPERARAALGEALDHVLRAAPRPAIRVTASIERHRDPALVRPVVARATVDLGGRLVRAHAEEASEPEAIATLEARLHRGLRGLARRDVAARRRGGMAEPGEWRHGDRPRPRTPEGPGA